MTPSKNNNIDREESEGSGATRENADNCPQSRSGSASSSKFDLLNAYTAPGEACHSGDGQVLVIVEAKSDEDNTVLRENADVQALRRDFPGIVVDVGLGDHWKKNEVWGKGKAKNKNIYVITRNVSDVSVGLWGVFTKNSVKTFIVKNF